MSDRDKLIELISYFCEHMPHMDGQTWEEACADHLIANGVTVGKDADVPTKWIPVGERLPENDYGKHWKDRKQYLVMMSNGMYTVCRFGYKEYDWWIDRNDSVIGRFNQVVKWMELEPPKGDHGEKDD